MDRILQGLLDSKHPESLKEKFFQKILSSEKEQADSISVLNLAVKWSLNGCTTFECMSGIKVYESYSKTNVEIFECYFTETFLIHMMKQDCENSAAVIVLIDKSLVVLRKRPSYNSLTKVFQALVLPYLQQNNNLECLNLVIQLMTKFEECIPVRMKSELCCTIIDILSVADIPTDNCYLVRCFTTVQTIGKFLKRLWDTGKILQLQDSFLHLFSIISTPGKKPSVCLGTLTSLLPVEVVRKIIDLISLPTTEDIYISHALMCIIDWMRWPFTQSVDVWVLAILTKFECAKRFQALYEVTQMRIKFVFEHLKKVILRDAAMKILSHMLIKCQHSPDCFHEILPQLPDLVKELVEEKSASSYVCLEKLVQLVHVQMYLHSGFPELYDPVLKLLKEYPTPSTADILEIINKNQGSWKPGRSLSKDLHSRFQRSVTRKVGLCNVVNSCYMNSIIQVLFMLDDFRQNLLTLPVQPNGTIGKMQKVFCYLLLSQRPAYSPLEFYTSANPPWFKQYEQQDCAEFLSYLLHKFDEEEKKSKLLKGSERTLVNRTFYGKLKNSVECLHCRNRSGYKENFLSLDLALPSVEGDLIFDIKSLIDNYFTDEEMKGNNQFMCPNCKGHQDGIRQVTLLEAPEYLNLTLMRFSYNKEKKKHSKIMSRVDYPKELSLYVYDDSVSEQNQVNYVLCSVVVHSGHSSESGHYYSFARHSSLVSERHSEPSDALKLSDTLQNKWYLFNDERVTYTDFMSSHRLSCYKQDTPYFFIYRRVSNQLLNSPQLPSNLEDLLKKSIMPERLQVEISRDNDKFNHEEREAAARLAEEESAKNQQKRDFDHDRRGPPGNCGGGGGGGSAPGFGQLDTLGSKFIF